MAATEDSSRTSIVSGAPTVSSRYMNLLPGDEQRANYARQVNSALYSIAAPTPVSAPTTLLWSKSVSADLGFDRKFCESAEFAALMSGNKTFPGSEPFAMRYGGHQFGQWAGQLGDGRAINLGELATGDGRVLNLQLKGAGPTPYSRGADGRAVLRSSVREYLCSEAMFHLGVPTTRALSLVLTGDEVLRDMFYDGNAQQEPGAIVCRVAPTFIRFGHFQLCAYRGETEILKQLMDHTIVADFPHLPNPAECAEAQRRQVYLRWFEEVCRRTGDMVLAWMRVGFVHGVMNTDNMSILGLTIDYGPYGWIDDYNPEWTPNTTDAQGRRYRFGQQADIALWNLYQLANALLVVLEDPDPVQKILEDYQRYYDAAWTTMMLSKLGLTTNLGESDDALLAELLALLAEQETDMTIFYRKLADFDPSLPASDLLSVVEEAFYAPDAMPQELHARYEVWANTYATRLRGEALDYETRKTNMNAVNPWFVLRNYLAQEAIEHAQKGDYSMLYALDEALLNPYVEQAQFAQFFAKRPEWARHRAGASMLSCSS